MPYIDITTMRGMMPRVVTSMLPEHSAVLAETAISGLVLLHQNVRYPGLRKHSQLSQKQFFITVTISGLHGRMWWM